jgi:hypothetical protein
LPRQGHGRRAESSCVWEAAALRFRRTVYLLYAHPPQ